MGKAKRRGDVPLPPSETQGWVEGGASIVLVGCIGCEWSRPRMRLSIVFSTDVNGSPRR